jgi:hypothetical protein
MDWRTAARRSLVILLLIAVPAKAQDPMQPSRVGPGTAAYRIGGGLESESLPAEIAEDLIYTAPEAFRFGPTPVSEVGLLQALLRAPGLFGDEGFRTFGWVEGGYTGASTRPGLLSVQTRRNRFGDEFLLNQLGFVLQNPLEQDDSILALTFGISQGRMRP